VSGLIAILSEKWNFAELAPPRSNSGQKAAYQSARITQVNPWNKTSRSGPHQEQFHLSASKSGMQPKVEARSGR
jgi:hypothetical protein